MARIKRHESLNDDDDVILHDAHSSIQLEKNNNIKTSYVHQKKSEHKKKSITFKTQLWEFFFFVWKLITCRVNLASQKKDDRKMREWKKKCKKFIDSQSARTSWNLEISKNVCI